MKIKKSKYDILSESICLILLIGILIYLVASWSQFPNRVPMHHNAIGEIDRWGNKSEILLLPAIAWGMYLLFTVIEHLPQMWNTGVTLTEENKGQRSGQQIQFDNLRVMLTEENKERVYRNLKDMINTMKLMVVGVFWYLTINTGRAEALPSWFLLIYVILLLGSMAFHIIKLVRER